MEYSFYKEFVKDSLFDFLLKSWFVGKGYVRFKNRLVELVVFKI